jgi:hypothetical protein
MGTKAGGRGLLREREVGAGENQGHFNFSSYIPVHHVPVINPAGELMTGKCVRRKMKREPAGRKVRGAEL